MATDQPARARNSTASWRRCWRSRRFEPSAAVPRAGAAERPRGLRAGRARPAGLVGRAGRAAALVRALGDGARRLQPALLQVVHRRAAERLLQLPRPPRAGGPGRAGRVPLARRGGRRSATSPTRSCSPRSALRQRAEGSRACGRGDVVGIYLPMIPEVVVAMLACARIGAPHNVVFGGFSAEAVRERMEFSEAKVLITVDGAARKGKTAPVKDRVDEVMGDLDTLEKIVVVRSKGTPCEMREGRDVYYDEILAAADAGVPGRAAGRRAPPLHPLHLRLHRQAEGHPAHHRGLPHRRVGAPTATCSTSSRSPTCTGAPPTSAGSPATPTSSTARSPTAPPR